MTRTGLLVLLALLSSGCGDADAPVPPRDEPRSEVPLVAYQRTGGVAAQPREVVIDRLGRARLTVVTHGTQRDHTRFRLGARELTRLEEAVEAARGIEAPEPVRGCADCYEYAVSARDLRFTLDSVSYGDAATPDELVALVRLLEDVAERARQA